MHRVRAAMTMSAEAMQIPETDKENAATIMVTIGRVERDVLGNSRSSDLRWRQALLV